MTLPEPPEVGFQPKNNEGELIGLRILRTEMVPDTFGRNNGQPSEGAVLEIYPLTGKSAGQIIGPLQNTSRLGRQFFPVAGNGQVYYGRLKGENVGAGRSIILGEPYASDAEVIAKHRAQTAVANSAPASQGSARPHDYRDDAAHQQAAEYQPPAQPAAPAAPARPPGMSDEEFKAYQEWQASKATASAGAASNGSTLPQDPPF